MRIYLGELSHTGNGRSPNVVPLAAGYLAAYVTARRADVDVKIFRDPEELLSASREAPPDIAGFSIYDWSENLSAHCARQIKEISPRTVTIAGGASIDDIDAELQSFLHRHPEFDVCAPNEGENALLGLVDSMYASGSELTQAVEGCAWLGAGGLVRGEFRAPDLAEIPSPYLSGFLDRFLEEGYEPVLQSMRGCPYRCAFCVSGTSNWSKMVGFDLDRVIAEFEYIKERTKSDYLILTDENLGILRDRDVKLAEYLVHSFETSGYPARLYFYTAKLVTDYVLKVVETIAPIGEFGISFQTLDDGVRREVKRTNTGWPKFLEYVDWARDHGIQSSTELIFGLPGETADGYIAGIERLLRSGVDRVYSYNLRLLSGIDLNTHESRSKYGFKTKFRLPDRDYGCYEGIVVNEVEEVVVGSDSFDFDDYLTIRKFGLFLELVSGRAYLSDLVDLMVRSDLPGEKLVGFLARSNYENSPLVRHVIEDYERRVGAELFDTPEECTRALTQLLDKTGVLPETKLNYVFVGRLMLDQAIRSEFFEVVCEFIDKVTDDFEQRRLLVDLVENVAFPRVVAFRPDEETVVTSTTSIDVQSIRTATDVSVIALDEPDNVEWELHPDSLRLLSSEASELSETAMQDIYMGISRFGLVRRPRQARDE